MTMKRLLFTLMLGATIFVQAQDQVKSYVLQKGQVFDIICLRTNEDVKEDLDEYFKRFFPVAQEMGYVPLKGLKVTESPTQGNYWPTVLALGTWKDIDGRTQFLERMTKEEPDFHTMRRKIWNSFYLTYWQVQEDQSFNIDPSKFNVVTAYWQKDERAFRKFKSAWRETFQESGGEYILELTDGSSPFGYHYDPDYLVITTWEDREAFERFTQENLELDHGGVEHVNQFVVQ